MAAATVLKGLTPKPLSIWTCRSYGAISAISLCFLTHLYGSRSSLLPPLPPTANFFKTNNEIEFLDVYLFLNIRAIIAELQNTTWFTFSVLDDRNFSTDFSKENFMASELKSSHFKSFEAFA